VSSLPQYTAKKIPVNILAGNERGLQKAREALDDDLSSVYKQVTGEEMEIGGAYDRHGVLFCRD
jgi:hypothetical protein